MTKRDEDVIISKETLRRQLNAYRRKVKACEKIVKNFAEDPTFILSASDLSIFNPDTFDLKELAHIDFNNNSEESFEPKNEIGSNLFELNL